MIHTLEIDQQSQPLELKKVFRKKLMTGGAVVRLRDELDEQALREIFETFAPEAEEYSLNAMVLTEIAKCEQLNEELLSLLSATELVSVRRALAKRQEQNQ